MTAIVWFRRDLRVADHRPLLAALREHGHVVPLFVREPSLLAGPASGARRTRRMEAALVALDEQLRARGGRLIVRDGPAPEAIVRLAAETGATEVFAHRDYTPFGRRREAEVQSRLPLRLEPGVLLVEPEAIPEQRVFAAFHRRWVASRPEEPLGAPLRVPVPSGVASAPLQPVAALGELGALRRAVAFAADGADHYADRRDRLDLEGTSHLSTDLHLGTISVRQVVALVADEAFRRQLAWRDWAHHLLWWRPDAAHNAWRTEYRSMRWRDDPAGLDAWRQGMTGFPTVDAGMRQLAAEGWIPNRARLIVASFLAKHLLVDWRAGERHFLVSLEDGDIANNSLGWQWVAGVGTDAAPWFRILDPVRQGERFDPAGTWVRRWIPELADVPDELVHRPWDAAPPPHEYPSPIVDRAEARARATAAFRAARAGSPPRARVPVSDPGGGS